jgi:hypothetical protein
VQRDWRAWLPVEKDAVFNSYVRELEVSYTMFSVALNEAIGFRKSGDAYKSCQALFLVPELSLRLTSTTAAVLRSLGEHAKHYGTVPSVAPLDPENFQGSKEQHVARMNDLLSRILFTQRSQFLHKISTLEEMLDDLEIRSRRATEDLGCGTSADPTEDWNELSNGHYDLNTCLRETIVLLKCFLRVVPEDQLGAFQKTVRAQMKASRPLANSRPRAVNYRRMAPVGGE